jgi:hypothetical protein
MASADQYRVKAAEFLEKIKAESSPTMQVEHARMAASYFRLAELADRNAKTDPEYETPIKPGAA